jgi:hypothetical protein
MEWQSWFLICSLDPHPGRAFGPLLRLYTVLSLRLRPLVSAQPAKKAAVGEVSCPA